MVPERLKQKDAQGIYIDPTTREFESLRAMIDQKLAQNDLLFQHDEMGDHVHNLNLLLGKLSTLEALESTMPPIRDDYRARISPEAYAAYIGSPSYKALMGCNRTSDPATRLRLLQADYIQLINEIRKLTLLEYHIEETRSYLVKKLRRTLFKLLIAPAAIVLFFLLARVMMAASDPASGSAGGNGFVSTLFGAQDAPTTLYNALVLATLLSLAAMAGAVGSFISALLRIEAVPETNEIARSVVALRYSESIRLAPLTGFVFAILLSFIFGGQLLTGSLFPDTTKEGANWPNLLFVSNELAKWLVWAFIVGFAERLMPDMIDRLVARAGKTMQPAASTPQSNGAKPLFVPDQVTGTNGNGTHRRVGPTMRKKRRVRAHAA